MAVDLSDVPAAEGALYIAIAQYRRYAAGANRAASELQRRIRRRDAVPLAPDARRRELHRDVLRAVERWAVAQRFEGDAYAAVEEGAREVAGR